MTTMKAARFYAAKDVRVEETSIPSVKPNQVKIQVKYCGICGTDLHEYLHGPIMVPTKEPHPLSGHCGVTTLGHEITGVVVEVGDGVKKDSIKVGDRVVVEPIHRNLESVYTIKGDYNLSEPRGFIGLTVNGGLTKYVVVEDYMIHKIPDSVSFEQAALVEPTSVAMHAIKSSGLKPGESCAIFGAGPVGLLSLVAAKAVGAGRIIVVDISEQRLAKAKELGATLTIKGDLDNIPQQIKDYTDGVGADVYIEAAGVQSTFTTGLASLKNGGKAMLIAIFSKPVTLNALDIVIREISIKGIAGYRHVFPEVIKMIDTKQLDVERLITKKIKLDNFVKDGLEALASDPTQIKILVEIDSD